ncbi:MAG TPA: DUF5916 domain-containing protein [Cyclobacteriaceae bacterium]|nr:DUF5916 domain-containing protein [Cyclobacteriaceae bacterium]
MNPTKHLLASVVMAASVMAVEAQEVKKVEKKQYQARRVETAPRIDGKLDDDCWLRDVESFQFIQTNPNNGAPSLYKTTVQLVYTDRAIYVGALLHDPNPEKILREFGQRDDDDRNADYFGILLDTYNSGINGFAFVISAAGVQIDTYFTADDDDDGWDAVWSSNVKIMEEGWIVEMEIPYFALRFPKQDIQTWGVNFYRNVKREQEDSFWNHVDNSVSGLVNQSGVLHGIENIQPPLRLSFFPYATAIYTHDGLSGTSGVSFAGGMDLKYGINESYTLDLSLIPDFTQVQSDNIIYNLSPFEVRYNENRQFFTEGTELFNKGNLFYSRRVGQTFGDVLYDEESEEIVSRPSSAPLINATKISGRDKKGLGLGFFNATTSKTHATIRNSTTGEKHQVQVDPLTNFNMVVVDKNMKNNSNINFTNTNVIRGDGGRDANVSGLSVSLRDKTNTYQASGFGSVDAIFTEESGKKSTNTGYKYELSLSKISGTWQYGVSRQVESYDYEINDMGYLEAPNEISHEGWLSYNIFKPVWKINRFQARIGGEHVQLHKPHVFTGFGTFVNFDTQFKNFWSAGLEVGSNPVTGYDYFEPRYDGYKFIQYPSWNFNMWFETDSRKALYVNGYKGRWERPEWGQQWNWIGLFARYRVSNKLSFFVELNVENANDNIGYAFDEIYDPDGNLEEIIFGRREREIYNNIAGIRLTFTNKMGLNVRVRQYWTTIEYEKFYKLEDDGELGATSYTGLDGSGNPTQDNNYNAFNVDFVYFWQIAPGSFLNFVWKDAIQYEDKNMSASFSENLGNTIQAPQVNSISLRITYFIDYLTLKQSLHKK